MTDDPHFKIGDVVRTPASEYPQRVGTIVAIEGQIATVEYGDGEREDFEASALSPY
jgi:hypothetical protein